MSAGEGLGEGEALEVGEGSVGEAQETSDQELAALGDAEPPPESMFDELQQRFRETRRKGGPDLDAETMAREEAQEDVPDVAPTETEEAAQPETEG
jgi:hypothetical protein